MTSQWKEPAKELSFRLIEAPSYVKGKNTTDIALVMDAMDLLHSGTVSGFCIVASDGDYTLLAQRIREAGLLMLGYGESKTPAAFVNSCRQFLFSDKEPEKIKQADMLLLKEADLFDKAFETAADGKVELVFDRGDGKRSELDGLAVGRWAAAEWDTAGRDLPEELDDLLGRCRVRNDDLSLIGFAGQEAIR